MHNPQLSLYCHLPWCIEKCPYCDFNSFKKTDSDHESRYTEALCQDLIASAELADQRPLRSIFFGGGTPSLFATQHIATILTVIQQHFRLQADCEITLEMNPSTFEIAKLQDYLAMGINRISIGVQSLNQDALQRIGRTHSDTEALRAIQAALSLPFRAVNVDIMYGLPAQTCAEAMADLDAVIALAPPHISWYELTIEANTYFAKYQPCLPDDDTQYRMYRQGLDKLAHAGYARYEISAYARQGQPQCQHNLNYWEFEDYLGCGNGASSKITRNGQAIRFQKYRNPSLYQANPTARIQTAPIDPADILFEFMLNRLRLMSSIPWTEIISKTRLSQQQLRHKLAPCFQQGYLQDQAHAIVLTARGLHFMNDCQALLLQRDS